MIEHYTEALVLDKEDLGDFDSRVYLYSKDFGKGIAKATSARKITSKLAAHLEPGNFIQARLIQSSNWRMQIADALKIGSVPKNQNTISILNLIKELTPDGHPEEEIWEMLKKDRLSGGEALKIFGFDSQFAICRTCGASDPPHFLLKDLEYSCSPCFLQSGRPASFILE